MGRSPAVAVRRAEALKMRANGRSYDDIAEALGYGSPASARKDLSRAMGQVIQEAGKELLTLETTRTENILSAAWGIITDPTADNRDKALALREATRILDRRAKLLGLDADSAAGKARLADDDAEEVQQGLFNFATVIRDGVRLEALADAFRVYAAAVADVLDAHNIPASVLPDMPDVDADYTDDAYTAVSVTPALAAGTSSTNQ